MKVRSESSIAARLDPREQHFLIPSNRPGRSLFFRYLPSAQEALSENRIVLYVHGGTFPSAPSIAHRFDGRSWREELCDAGFHVWGLDFNGFGSLSVSYPEMEQPAGDHPPLGRADDACQQLHAAVSFICAHHGVTKLSIVAHSWGTIVSGLVAGRYLGPIDRLVFFGAIARRAGTGEPARLPA